MPERSWGWGGRRAEPLGVQEGILKCDGWENIPGWLGGCGGRCKCKQKADWEEGVTVLPALRDLLGQEPQEKLEIRLCPDGSGQLYVPGLTEFQVQSVEDINKVRSWAGQRWEASAHSGLAPPGGIGLRCRLFWVCRPLGACFLPRRR